MEKQFFCVIVIEKPTWEKLIFFIFFLNNALSYIMHDKVYIYPEEKKIQKHEVQSIYKKIPHKSWKYIRVPSS